MGTQKEIRLRWVGDDCVHNGARRDVARFANGISGVLGKDPGFVPLLGYHEGKGGLVAGLQLPAGAAHGGQLPVEHIDELA